MKDTGPIELSTRSEQAGTGLLEFCAEKLGELTAGVMTRRLLHSKEQKPCMCRSPYNIIRQSEAEFHPQLQSIKPPFSTHQIQLWGALGAGEECWEPIKLRL